MSVMNLIFEKIELDENVHFEKERGTNGIELTLHYPTPGAAVIKSIRSLDLFQDRGRPNSMFYSRKPEEVLKQLEKIPGSSSGGDLKAALSRIVDGELLKKLKENNKDWSGVLPDVKKLYKHRKELYKIWELLFRQNVTRAAMLRVQVTAVREAHAFEKLFVNSLLGGFSAVASTIEGFVGVTGLATNAIDSTLESFKPKDKNYIFAEGVAEIPENFSSKELSVGLFCPETIKLKKPKKYDSYGKIDEFYEKELRIGQKIGEISFRVEFE